MLISIVLHFVGMGSDDWMSRPWAWRVASINPEEEAPRCFCQDICKAKQSDDWDKTRGRRFWLCPNYCRDKEEPKSAYDRPKVCLVLMHANFKYICVIIANAPCLFCIHRRPFVPISNG